MQLSRLRLRLGLGFSLAFSLGLAILATVSLGYLWRESHRRLDQRLTALANDVSINIGVEWRGTPNPTAEEVALEVVGEWPRNGGSFAICDDSLRVLAHTDSAGIVGQIVADAPHSNLTHFDVRVARAENFRAAELRFPISAESASPAFRIIAFSSTAGISEDTELLLAAVGVAAPIIILLSLTGGYLMAARALRPVTDLANAVANIAPSDLSQRLEVQQPTDELGELAAEFNAMLGRLSAAQTQNRRFVREAAHQIRTPLTLVLGEAALELASLDSPREQMRGSLTRIGLAAERMRRRVDELFLLAEAQTGERVMLTEHVELDQIVFRAAELMRPRAVSLGKSIAVGTAEMVAVKGNSELLNEALLELLENAIRHGDASRSVQVSVTTGGQNILLAVTSGGQPFALPPRTESDGPDGLGLPIVRWVAESHGGEIEVINHAGWNAVVMTLPKVN